MPSAASAKVGWICVSLSTELIISKLLTCAQHYKCLRPRLDCSLLRPRRHDFMLLRFLITLSRFRRAMAPKLDRWIQDGVFQLQRRAYEAKGEGSWQHIDKEIPVTTGKERLGDLPIESVVGSSLSEVQECSSCSARKLRSMKSWATDTTAVEAKSWRGFKR